MRSAALWPTQHTHAHPFRDPEKKRAGPAPISFGWTEDGLIYDFAYSLPFSLSLSTSSRLKKSCSLSYFHRGYSAFSAFVTFASSFPFRSSFPFQCPCHKKGSDSPPHSFGKGPLLSISLSPSLSYTSLYNNSKTTATR